jgi:hypothetical protein
MMYRRLVWVILTLVFVLLAGVTSAQDVSGNQAFLRVLQLASDVKTVSLTLENGSTVLTNLTSFSVSDYAPYVVGRSTLITLTITPTNALAFVKGWTVPPLTAGHYTAALVGSSADNTLDLVFIDEDNLCDGKTSSGACIIFINNLKGSPPVTLVADNSPVIQQADYRHVVVGSAAEGSFQNLTAIDPYKPNPAIVQLPRGFFEPNIVYIYSLYGNYPGRVLSDYNLATVRRVSVDTMTFLRGLKAYPQLTDGVTLFSLENIVAILEQSGYDQLLVNPQLTLTVFAPTDAAVLQAPSDVYLCVTSNANAMKALILNHIIVGPYSPAQLVAAGKLPTMAGTSYSFTSNGSGFIVDGTVQVADSRWYPTLNGHVYITDSVLIPTDFSQQYCQSG